MDSTEIRPTKNRERIAARVGGYLFLAGASVTALSIVLPHPDELDTTGYWALCAFMLLLAALIWSRRDAEAVGAVPWVIVIASVAVVTAAVYFNGERSGGPSLLNELYYVWCALYIGYFFRPSAIAGVVVVVGLAYAWALNAIEVDTETGVTRWIITVSVSA